MIVLKATSTNNALTAQALQIWRRCTNNMNEYTPKITKEKYCELLTEIRLNSNCANFVTRLQFHWFIASGSPAIRKKKKKKKHETKYRNSTSQQTQVSRLLDKELRIVTKHTTPCQSRWIGLIKNTCRLSANCFRQNYHIDIKAIVSHLNKFETCYTFLSCNTRINKS